LNKYVRLNQYVPSGSRSIAAVKKSNFEIVLLAYLESRDQRIYEASGAPEGVIDVGFSITGEGSNNVCVAIATAGQA
jgi:hypothetical protein